ncbi:Heavy metal translocating P-type ATPase [Bacillus mycoides]|nr:Heavy metal translocating P-type ATPase [Bacillus mycoides]
MLLLQQEISLVIGIIGISFFEEQHDAASSVVSSFSVLVSPLQQEVFLATGTIGISFLEEQHDEVSVVNSSFVGAMEES